MASGEKDSRETRARIEGRLERLRRLFVLGDVSEPEYRGERDGLEAKRSYLTPSRTPDLQKAADLVRDF